MLTLFRQATDTGLLGRKEGGFPLPVEAASMCRLATGRSALAHLISRTQSMNLGTVLMPCYVPEGVIQPFLNAGLDIVFYRLRSDLTPENDDLARLLKEARGSAIVILVHYFGFPARTPELDAVLAAHGALVVDDLAHAPFARSRTGEPFVQSSDITLLSLNKFLPVADGAILISQRADVDVAIDEAALSELPAPALQAYRRHLEAARDLAGTDDVETARAALGRIGSDYEIYYASINSDLRPHRQSEASQVMEAAYPAHWLAERRVQNTQILYETLRTDALSLVHPQPLADVVPFCVPARVRADRREEIVNRTFERGVVLSTLQAKWDFVPRNRREHFGVECAFLREHVLIPVSESIAPDAMRCLATTLNEL